jgi:hypothetical protein
MALSAAAVGLDLENRTLRKLHYAMANDAEDIGTAASGDIMIMLDASDNYEPKYADAANVLEMIGSISQGLTVGEDGTGYDVLFYSATAGKSWLWDESADKMIVTGTSSFLGAIDVGIDGTGHDVNLYGATAGQKFFWDESADTAFLTCTVDIDGTVTVGVDDTGYDVKFFGATTLKYFLWDESADTAIIAGGLTVSDTVTLGATALTATGVEINKLDDSVTVLTAGAGVSAAETNKSGYFKNGGITHTWILVDLTGLVGSASDTDIIGNTGGAASAHFGQITAALNGTIAGGKITCLEVPAGGADDIDFYSATVSTGAQDGLITDLTETVLVTSGGAWASGTVKGMTGVPPANDYLYICNGEAVAGTYTAGKFLIEFYGV